MTPEEVRTLIELLRTNAEQEHRRNESLAQTMLAGISRVETLAQTFSQAIDHVASLVTLQEEGEAVREQQIANLDQIAERLVIVAAALGRIVEAAPTRSSGT